MGKEGYIHSIETFGTVDGPGVRFVIFFQGCPMRCKYCHNPDTWNMQKGTLMSVSDIIERFERNRSFYRTGGITVSGGEPMVQIKFLTELFREAKKRKISTCLDTSGIMFPGEANDKLQRPSMQEIDTLLEVTDLVMLDIKHMDLKEHIDLTGHSNKSSLDFAKYLEKKQKSIWIRHVVVPEITYKKEELNALGSFLSSFKHVEKIDVLPYHSMGKVKYDNLGIAYPLKDTRQLKKEEVEIARKYIKEGLDTAIRKNA